MKITIKEIAELAGVSVTTVSQILNNKGSRFSEQTRKKVLAIVEEYQYKPDFFAANLINRHSKTIGMIVPDVTDFFFSKVIEGVESYLNPLGYMIILCNSRHDKEQEKRYLNELSHRSVDGILLATPNHLEEEHALGSDFYRKHPIVLIDRGLNDRDWGQLLVQEYAGAQDVLRMLVDKGHRHIGMLKESEGYYQLTERVKAYRQVVYEYQLPFEESYICSGELTISGGYHAAKEVLKNKKITAIFCGNDEMAIGCYQAVYEAGLKIPEDISVVGFDGLEVSQYMVPPLTTVFQPSTEIGFSAAKFLVDAINFPSQRIPNKIFQTKLIIRESVKNVGHS
ncbi:MAG: LacI family DNA-binding transcriptional regulator [Enterococcus gilvus]|nr:LacI family DNA-binding transcriptional regulator [Enterococcus gilvus]